MVIVVATEEEKKLIEEIKLEVDEDYRIIVTGVGGINVIKALKDLPRNTRILNIGYAGSNNIPIGEVCDIGRVDLFCPTVNYKKNYSIDLGGRTRCFTSNDFVLKTKIKKPCVFDMELGFICALFNDVVAIKVVSDNLSYNEYANTIAK